MSIYIDVGDGTLIAPPPATAPPAPAPAPAPAAPAPAPIPQPGVVYIDVGDGTLIQAPPATTAPPPPPPPPAPTPAPQPIPLPGQPLIDVGDGTTIVAPPAGAPPPPLAPVPEPTPSPPPPAPTIPQPGVVYIDVGDGTTIVAPPASAPGTGGGPPDFGPPPAPDVDVGDRRSPLDPEDGPDLDGRELQAVTNPVLRGEAFADYVRTRSAHYNLDAVAVIANYFNEGSSGKIGDDGHAYGPWQIWATDGRLRNLRKYGTYSDAVNTWTWSRDGVDYALRSMVAGGAAGLRGHPAVHAIVYGFERPANMRAQDLIRQDDYDQLLTLGDRLLAMVAANAPGPVHTVAGVTPGAGAPAGGAAPTHEPAAGDVHTAWSDLMHVFGRKLPDVTDDVRKTRRAITRALT